MHYLGIQCFYNWNIYSIVDLLHSVRYYGVLHRTHGFGERLISRYATLYVRGKRFQDLFILSHHWGIKTDHLAFNVPYGLPICRFVVGFFFFFYKDAHSYARKHSSKIFTEIKYFISCCKKNRWKSCKKLPAKPL